MTTWATIGGLIATGGALEYFLTACGAIPNCVPTQSIKLKHANETLVACSSGTDIEAQVLPNDPQGNIDPNAAPIDSASYSPVLTNVQQFSLSEGGHGCKVEGTIVITKGGGVIDTSSVTETC